VTAIDSSDNSTTVASAALPVEENVPGSEAALMERLRRGESDAFEELVRDHGGHLLSVARRLLRQEEDARDAVQDAFLLAFRGLPAFAGRCRLSTWLHRITVNAALMKLRTRSRKPEAPFDDLLPDFLPDGHHVMQFTDWSLSPSQHLLRRETREQVRAAIDRLPDSYRTVLLLRDIEDLDTGEVAGMLGMTTNAVKIRLHRARQALRTLLDPVFAGDTVHVARHVRPALPVSLLASQVR
jgi:RNA polymerase sigma-70 factor, ECF subfamily